MVNTTEPGKWYIAVDCAKCGEAVPFAEVPSPEDAPDRALRRPHLLYDSDLIVRDVAKDVGHAQNQ
jgi:hypothetical protein